MSKDGKFLTEANEILGIKEPKPPDDPRYVRGAICLWHDNIDKTAVHPEAGIPCCPHCLGVLYEHPTAKEFWEPIEKYAKDNNKPEYVDLWKWSQGKCFRTYEEMCNAFEARSQTSSR